ncbi:MAG: MFS transporter [Hyphomicrobiales bacterium]|nr:MFS transporter [Hyphomicrobiales bacterium]
MTEIHKPASNGGFESRLSSFYFASFLIPGCYLAYLPLWLNSKGLSDLQISIIYAAPIFLRSACTPLLTFLADRSGKPLRFLVICTWCAMASVALLPLTHGFYTIFFVILLFTVFWMSVIPLTDAAALAGARLYDADYGRMRLWGSISFIIMAVAGGAAIDLWGPETALWLLVSSSAAIVFVAQWLPQDAQFESASGPNATPRIRAPLRVSDLMMLVRRPALWIFIAATGAINAAHAVFYIFGSLHWTKSGISPSSVGALWAIGVIAEVVLFAYGKRVTRLTGTVQLIVIAGLASVLRWTTTAFDPPLALLFLVQAMHGLTFGAMHLGAMHFLQKAVPPSLSASAQGLYAAMTAGAAMGLASLAAGPLYRNFGGEAFLAMAVLSGAGTLAAIMLLKQWDGELITRTEQTVS